MNLDVLRHSNIAKRGTKFLIGGRQARTIRSRGKIVRMRINRDDRTKAIMTRHFREHHGGPPFETANFHDRAFGTNASGQKSEESSFVLSEESRNVLGCLPSIVNNCINIGRKMDHKKIVP